MKKKIGAAAFASEEARRQIFERAWNAGRNAAVFAQDAVSSEEVRRQYIQTYTHTHTHTHTLLLYCCFTADLLLIY